MSEEVKKRVRRSPEEIAAEIDDKIAAHKDAIKKLEQRKAEVLAPKKAPHDQDAKNENGNRQGQTSGYVPGRNC